MMEDLDLAKNIINDILSYMEESSKEISDMKRELTKVQMDVQRITQHLSSVLSDQGSTHM